MNGTTGYFGRICSGFKIKNEQQTKLLVMWVLVTSFGTPQACTSTTSLASVYTGVPSQGIDHTILYKACTVYTDTMEWQGTVQI